MSRDPRNESVSSYSRLLVEMLAFFVLLPTLLFFLPPLPVLPFLLWIFTAICYRILARDPAFDRKNFWRSQNLKDAIRPVLIRFAVNALLLGVMAWLFLPGSFFILVRELPLLWLLILLLYPLLSVYPQELIYRTWFFHRYHPLFPGRSAMIGANALLFGYMHIIFHNPVAVVLTLLGGILFAKTYLQTRSTLLASIEHSLYGGVIFTIGLGHYFFYGDTQRIIEMMGHWPG